MPSLRSQLVIAFLRMTQRKRIYASLRGLHDGIRQVRQAGPALPSAGMRRRIAIREQHLAGVPVYHLSPRASALSGRHLLYLHGGAYVRPITRHHWRFLCELVERSGVTLSVPLYPLAPESACRQTVATVREVYQQLCVQARLPALGLMGDSAGGGLALALCHALHEQGAVLPEELVLICPWLDVRMQHAAIAASESDDPMLAAIGLREAGRLYAGELGTDHPHVSPIEGDPDGLPPMLIFVGTRDIACHDALLFAERCRAAGGQVECVVGEGMIHVWPILPIPEGRQALAKIVRRLGSRVLEEGRNVS